MTKVIKILLVVVLFAISAFAQLNREYYDLSFPKFIPVNSTFEVSFVTTKAFNNASVLEILIQAGSGTEIKSAELRYSGKKIKLKVLEVENSESLKKNKSIVVDFSDSTLGTNDFFQVLLSFKNENVSADKIGIAGIYKNNNKILGYCTYSEDDLYQESVEPYYTELNLEFYKPQKLAGRSLQLSSESYLNIKMPEQNAKYLLLDFWLKLNNVDISILSLEDKRQQKNILELKYNPHLMVYTDFIDSELEYSKPEFISRKMWNHISVIIEKNTDRIRFFSDGKLLSKGKLPPGISTADLSFKFKINAENKSCNIEQLRLIEFDDDINKAFINNNYNGNTLDGSNAFLLLKFDTSDEFTTLLQKQIIEFGGIQLVKSDAPLFTTAPELNIALYKNSIELNWNSVGKNIASVYILEKSIQAQPYLEVVKVQAIDDQEKIYSYTDVVDELAGIVYYRIKQVNKDGSVVYSGSVKVGQGKLEDQVIVEQNFPNPFNPKTSIVVDLLEASEVHIVIYNLEGREVVTLQDGVLEKGQHKFNFDGTELPSGIYLYKVTTPSFSQTRKMILAK
ncbi:MAG: T9SS type A sorting domain-containing protein [Ignavibacteriales bacterium]|nr:MAG: T9SS type A sorting domain-containing protein [Ignavibacteriales bacterium]